MQRDKIFVLSTRPSSEAFIEKASDANISIESFSFIDVQSVRSNELANQLQLLATKSLVAIFTSTNAINAVAEQLSTNPGWRIFCIGGRTKELAIQVFGENNILGSAKHAVQLAERIISYGQAKSVTFFCGDQRLNELPDMLIKNGINREELIVYTTVQTPVLIEKNYDGILFFSPSAVHSFFSANTIAIDVVLFSIGQTTTATIQSYCTNPIITSEWPGGDNLLACVTDFYNQTRVEGTIS